MLEHVRNIKHNHLNFLILLFCAILSIMIFNQMMNSVRKDFYRKNGHFHVTLDCQKVVEGDRKAQHTAIKWRTFKTINFTNIFHNCDSLQIFTKLAFESNTPEEADYPIAYVLIVQRNLGQILKLLSAIYWPQNLYCITFDMKSPEAFRNYILMLSECYPNIITPTKHLKIYWGHFSVLEAAVNCLKSLNAHRNKWNYVQIISWNDVPLKTNFEMVRIFKILNGSNDNELKSAPLKRYNNPHYFVPKTSAIPSKYLGRPHIKILPSFAGNFIVNKSAIQKAPHGAKLYKGSFGATLSRAAVDFIINDKKARDLFEFLKLAFVPDELYWSTLIHNPNLGMPGSFPGCCLEAFEKNNQTKPQISRFDEWNKRNCFGIWVHMSCVFGVKNLKDLAKKPHLIAHKVYEEIQPATLDCLLELLKERTMKAREGKAKFDTTYYENMPSVLHQNGRDEIVIAKYGKLYDCD